MVFSCKLNEGSFEVEAAQWAHGWASRYHFGKIGKRYSFLSAATALYQGTWTSKKGTDSILVNLPSPTGALVQCTTCTTICRGLAGRYPPWLQSVIMFCKLRVRTHGLTVNFTRLHGTKQTIDLAV